MRPPRHREAAQAHARGSAVVNTGDLPRFGSRGAPQAFGHKLAAIIANEPSSVVSWNRAGTSFKIHDPKALQALLGKYFRHGNYSSFQRQMNLYGFKRITEGAESGAHMHPSFLRDQPDLLVNVRRAVGPVVPPSPAPVAVAASTPAVEAVLAPQKAAKKAKKAPAATGDVVAAGSAEIDNAVRIKAEEAKIKVEEAAPSSGSAVASAAAAAAAAVASESEDSLAVAVGQADEEPLPLTDAAADDEEALSASISSMGVSSRFFFFDDNELERDAILALSDDEGSSGNDLGELLPALRHHADAAAQQIAASRGGSGGVASPDTASPISYAGACGPLQNVTAAAAAAAAGLLPLPPKPATDTAAEDDDMVAAAAAAASSRPGTPVKSPGLVEQLTSAIDTGFTSLLSGLRGERTSTGGGSSSGRPSLDRMSFSQMSFDMDDVPEKMQQSSPSSLSFSGGVDFMRSNSSRDWDNIFTESLQGFAEFFAV